MARNKREKFLDLAENRVEKCIKQIDLIGNLSNINNYEFTESDVKKIFSALEERLKASKKRFEDARAKKASPVFRLDR